MKLSFSTKGWHNRTFDDFCEIAKDLRFSGIELHNGASILKYFFYYTGQCLIGISRMLIFFCNNIS